MKDAAAALQRARPGAAVYDRQRKAKWAKHLAGCWQRCGRPLPLLPLMLPRAPALLRCPPALLHAHTPPHVPAPATPLLPPAAAFDPGAATAGTLCRWEISTFEYLMALNTLAGRTYNDLNQYPVSG